MADGITDEMIEKAAAVITPYMRDRQFGLPPDPALIARLAVAAALAGQTVTPHVCSRCGEHVGYMLCDPCQEAVDRAADRAVDDLPNRKWIEFCRACRDERDEIVPAEFILWGKLTPPEQLGPRCYDHTADYVGSTAMGQIDQWAIFDLRPFNRALTQSAQSTEDAGGVL